MSMSSDWHLSIASLTKYFKDCPLDTSKHSRQLQVDLGDIFKCHVSTRALVMAGLLTGHAVLPCEGGRVFRFFKVCE